MGIKQANAFTDPASFSRKQQTAGSHTSHSVQWWLSHQGLVRVHGGPQSATVWYPSSKTCEDVLSWTCQSQGKTCRQSNNHTVCVLKYLKSRRFRHYLVAQCWGPHSGMEEGGLEKVSAWQSSLKGRGPLAIKPSLELFYRQCRGNFSETGWRYLWFPEHVDTIFNWTKNCAWT